MLFEVEQAANRIRAEVDPDANIIFGNTILPDMEGRIRVSVVATGIDADVLKLPEKVHALRPNLRPMQPFRLDPAKPAAPVNPVQAQMDSLAAELNANGAPSMQADEAYILGGNEAPAIEEKLPEEAPIAATRYAATESYRPLNEQPLARPQPGKKGGWSLFGRRKTPVPDMRAEPKARHRPADAACCGARSAASRRRGSLPRSRQRRSVRDTCFPSPPVQLIDIFQSKRKGRLRPPFLL
jgi:cell division protein FtsZ